MRLIKSVIDGLDPGIRDLVVWLDNQNFNTTDSGDGVSKPDDERALDFPHVVMVCSDEDFFVEAKRLMHAINKRTLGWTVEATYSPESGRCVLLAYGPEPKRKVGE